MMLWFTEGLLGAFRIATLRARRCRRLAGVGEGAERRFPTHSEGGGRVHDGTKKEHPSHLVKVKAAGSLTETEAVAAVVAA